MHALRVFALADVAPPVPAPPVPPPLLLDFDLLPQAVSTTARTVMAATTALVRCARKMIILSKSGRTHFRKLGLVTLVLSRPGEPTGSPICHRIVAVAVNARS
jgi:hypothetical protein